MADLERSLMWQLALVGWAYSMKYFEDGLIAPRRFMRSDREADIISYIKLGLIKWFIYHKNSLLRVRASKGVQMIVEIVLGFRKSRKLSLRVAIKKEKLES